MGEQGSFILPVWTGEVTLESEWFGRYRIYCTLLDTTVLMHPLINQGIRYNLWWHFVQNIGISIKKLIQCIEFNFGSF